MDFEERMGFLLDICEQRYNSTPDSRKTSIFISPPASESIAFVVSRTRIWKRWVVDYNARTNIRINLFFNLANQADNKTNLEIASTSKKIAEETRKDSSSMITIAAVTMFFLPGSFVAVSSPFCASPQVNHSVFYSSRFSLRHSSTNISYRFAH